ncbi:MAG: outer membrane protein assembly factor BamA [Bacteriovoracaceae bacterium]
MHFKLLLLIIFLIQANPLFAVEKNATPTKPTLKEYVDESVEIGARTDYFKIDKILVEGNKKVESEAILEKIGAKPGMMLDNYLLRQDIARIYSMNYFDQVEAHQEGNTLIFKVKEQPIIGEIVIEGNDGIDSDDLKEQIKSKQFSILDVNKIKSDVKSLQKHYEEKGYFLASINYKTDKIDEENIKLTFQVSEYDKVKVKKITFLGNSAIKDEELKALMETREEALFSFMTNSGNFKEFNFQTDIERLTYFYKTKGYLQVNVGSPIVTVSEDRKWVFITLQITEGPQFSINKINFEGELLFSETELNEKITSKEQEIYSELKLHNDITALTEMYQDQGYAFANVLRTLDIVPGENKVNITFSFEKGKMAYFGKITIRGNTKTRDKVIRRELKIFEGLKYTGSGLRESKENVNRLGFFEKDSVVFNSSTPKGRDDVVEIDISVKERNTGSISLGAGYSSSSKGFFQGQISQQNFRGLGQRLAFTLNLAKDQQDYSLGFTEPRLLDTKWLAGGDIFRSRSIRRPVEEISNGFDLKTGYPVFEYTNAYITYALVEKKITLDPSAGDDIVKLENQLDIKAGNGIYSSITPSLVLDRRNNRFEPSGGHYGSLSSEFMGVGGEKRWVKLEAEGRYFKALYGDLVFRSRLVAAKINTISNYTVPRNSKFTLGGPKNLRGYTVDAIGPQVTLRDKNNLPYSFNSGGLSQLYSTLELEHPLVAEAGLKWVVFFDAGNVYEKYIGQNGLTMRTDYGFGLRWFSPIGVLRFEWGFPIAKKPNEDGVQFYFDLGQLF